MSGSLFLDTMEISKNDDLLENIATWLCEVSQYEGKPASLAIELQSGKTIQVGLVDDKKKKAITWRRWEE